MFVMSGKERSVPYTKYSTRQISPVDYRLLEAGLEEEVANCLSSKPKRKTRVRRKQQDDDPDYDPVTPSVKVAVRPSYSEHHPKRRVRPVDYKALDGGSEHDPVPGRAKGLRRIEKEGSVAKKPRVEISLGTPSVENDVLLESACYNASQESLPISPKRRFVLVRVPQDGSAVPTLPSTLRGLPSGTSAENRRVVLVRVPDRPPPPPPEPRLRLNMNQIEDALFMKEVNKFLAASMTNDLTSASKERPVSPPKVSLIQDLTSKSPAVPDADDFLREVNRHLQESAIQSRQQPKETPDKNSVERRVPQAAKSLICASKVPERSKQPQDHHPNEKTTIEVNEELVSCGMCGSCIRAQQLKRHEKICKGIRVRWENGVYVSVSEGSAVGHQQFRCPRCEAILDSDENFQMHVAIDHGFFWRLDFASKQEYRLWFMSESLDETMIAGQSRKLPDIEERHFYCAINGCRKSAVRELKCPCRLVVKLRPGAVAVRYFPAHNHPQRVLKRAMSHYCRSLIISLVREGKKNSEILAHIQRVFPVSSRNHYISKELISSVRYKFRHKQALMKERRELNSTKLEPSS